jgi:hypothetical protein
MSDITTGKRPPVATVREWTIALGILTAGQLTRAEAELKLRAYVPLLLDNFPVGAFTQDSLHHVAGQCKWFPSYAEVLAYLREWWREHRPAPPRITGPDTSASAQLDREAAALAADWDDPGGICRRIRDLGDDPRSLRLLCAVVQRHAPQHLGWFPPAVIEAMQQDAPVVQRAGDDHRATPRYATPAQLDQINPLPGGRKRDATTAANDRGTSPAAELRAAPVGPDAPAGDADAIPF